MMDLLDQLLVGSGIVAAELALIGAFLTWVLRKDWRALDDDLEESMECDEPSL